MPFDLDPNIPLSARGVTMRSPLERLMAVEELDLRREAAAAQAEQRLAIAEERRLRAQALQQAQDATRARGEAFKQGGGVRKGTLDWATQNAPDQVPWFTEFFDTADKRAAEIGELRNKLNDARLNHLGHLADGILSRGATPEAVQTGLALYQEQFPDDAEQVAQLGQRLQGMAPEQVRGFLEQQREAAPFWREKQGKNTPQVVAPGGALVDDAGNVLYTAPAKVETPAAGTFADFLASYAQDKGRTVAQLSPSQKLQAKAQWDAAGRAPTSDSEPLIAVMGDDGRPVLMRRSEAEGRTPASNREQGRPVTSGDAGKIADIDTSLDDLKVLDQVLSGPKATGVESRVRATLPDRANELSSGWGTEAKQRQAVIERVKQVIGKALEGGVLRKEDEAKYARILPTIGDTPQVAKSKIEGLQKALTQRRSTTLDTLEDAGYEVSRFRARESSSGTGAGGKVGRFEIVGVK